MYGVSGSGWRKYRSENFNHGISGNMASWRKCSAGCIRHQRWQPYQRRMAWRKWQQLAISQRRKQRSKRHQLKEIIIGWRRNGMAMVSISHGGISYQWRNRWRKRGQHPMAYAKAA